MLSMETYDKQWDFSDPEGSESRWRTAAQAAVGPERAEMLTQVARAQGLQSRWEDAEETLAEISDRTPVVRARVSLEQGRLLNSQGHPEAALPHFRRAHTAAQRGGSAFLAVDALHMAAIADPANAAVWTAQALALLDADEVTENSRIQRWRISVHNNLGWTLMDQDRPGEAWQQFTMAAAAASAWGTSQQQTWAAEALADCRDALLAAGEPVPDY